ncbi:MAG: dihydroorotase [Alphaproteobacteria bacterium]|nr:dihydroorotase [Alphaproteobacteria bacterium]MBU0795825.1 dihydroorotase [Alphaproteobacteria bacterium]MBU0886687.1 dihydroorotase [Alphaproteobacteria bacterium]MBU1814542.1 dihydroorotase [Alphaproteobacteria bacterium]
MSKRILLKNARLLDPATRLDRTGDLLVVGETIADVGTLENASADSVIECDGKALIPGLVDMRVQIREPGEEHKENLTSAAHAAAAGGITSMVCLPNTQPVIDDQSLVEFIAREARKIGLVKIFPYAAATRGLQGKELTEMGLLTGVGAVGFTDGVKPIASAQVMRLALSYARTFDQLIVQHAEEPSLTNDAGMNECEWATRLGLPGIPAAAETIMVDRDLRLVELTGGRLHFAHVSTADSIDAIRKAKARGLNVTCDTAPPYFTLNETAVGDYRSFAKLSPPLRSEADRLAVLDGIADGTIDAIASDHSPHDQDSKRLPFAQAESGAVGLETLLALTLAPVHQNKLDLLDALAALTCKPADILRLKLGRLAAGHPADLALIDIDRPWRIEASKFKSKSKNSPFDTLPVQGRALRSIVNGKTIFELES